MQVKIDQDVCIGCATCFGICPEVFEMSEGGYAQSRGEVTKDLQTSVEYAMMNCPVSVICWEGE